MIDYTQDAFAHPGLVLDPIPSIGDYLDDYQARNEAWYQSFAFPLGDGRYGARPSSFERRGLPTAAASQVEPDPAALPPIIQDGPVEDNRVLAGDRPAGALVRDLPGMTDAEVMAEGEFLSGPGKYAGNVASFFAGPGTGFGFVGGPMARSSVYDRLEDLALESLVRGLPEIAGQDPETIGNSGVTIERVGPASLAAVIDYESGTHQRGSDGPSQETYQGGEVGAGGWAGPGGL